MDNVFDGTKKRSHDFFHTFCVYPKMRFAGQHEGETIVLALRSHPITQVKWVVGSVLSMFAPFIFDIFLISRVNPSVLLFTHIFWWALIMSYAFYCLVLWIFNVGIITDERIIDVDYFFVNREVTEASMYNVADVTGNIVGFFPNLFDYGDVMVQTAGTNQNIEFPKTYHPNRAVEIISKLARIAHGNN